MAEQMTGRSDGKKDKQEEVEVNLLEGLPWKGSAQELDSSEDAWAASERPPHNIYEVQLALQEAKLVKYDPKDESTWAYVVNIEGRIQGGDYDNVPAFLRVSTRRNRGRKISTAEGALIKLGFKEKLPASVTPGMIAQALVKALQKGPVTKWEIDWRGSYQDSKGKWKNVAKTMTDFPKNGDGYIPEIRVTNDKGGTEVIDAQLNVVQWIGKGEEPKLKAGAKAVVADELELDDSPAVTTGIKNTAKPKEENDELVLD
jgi:hypothetical protein